MKRIIGWTVGVLVAWFFAALVFDPLAIPLIILLTLLWNLFFGWIGFLRDTLPRITVHWPAIGLSIATATLFIFGLHAAMRNWFCARRDDSVATDMTTARSVTWRFRGTFAVTVMVLLAFTAGVCVIGVAHQAIWMATSPDRIWKYEFSYRKGARRLESQSNLRQIALASLAYEASSRSLPHSTFDSQGRGLHGWQTRLLPHLDNAALHRAIDFEKSWQHPSNRPHFQQQLTVFLNPGVGSRESAFAKGYALTHYAGNSHVLGRLDVRAGEIADGAANTILGGEIVTQFPPWGHHANWRDPALGLNAAGNGFGGPWDGGCNLMMADGSVHFINQKIDRKVLKALATPDGHDDVSEWQR